MKLVRLVRFEDDGRETLGCFSVYDEDGSTELMTCKTVELPWKDNKNRISCIPTGRYNCVINKGSPNIKYTHYDVLNVRGRQGIKIHAGNYYTQILGCIIVGDRHADINGDGALDVPNSRMTLQKLIQVLGNKFELVIL